MRVRYHLVVAALIVTLMFSSFVAGWQFQASASTDGQGDIAKLVSVLAGGEGSSSGIDDVSLRPLETFQEVLNHLRKHYVSPIKDESKLTYGAVRGMLAVLHQPPFDDRYSRFMEPSDYRDFLDENQGHFGGIGAEIGVREVEVDKGQAKLPEGLRCPNCGAEITEPKKYQIVIVAPLPDSPAERAGVRAGDAILKVDDTSTAGLGLGETVKLIKGKPGTTVTLTLGRKGADNPLKVKITRAVIQVQSAKWKMLDHKIGYLHITTFNETTPAMVKKGLHELRRAGMKALLLDLRGNAGGELDSCIETASQFIGSGPVVYIEERGKPRKAREAVGGNHRIEVPLVVLINKGSASAAEILAGAIQDDKIGILMGTTTFGKGLVQTVYPLRDGSALVLTTARYLTPSLRDIDKKGIDPDVVVKQPKSKEVILPLSEKDAQAKAAIEYLRKQLAAPLRAAA